VAVAWLSEIEERDPEGNALCTGRFECAGEELPFREAVVWARAHADRAYIDIEFERYVLIGEDREIPRLPDELAERVARGLRRPGVDAWRDRPDDAEPIPWVIVATLSVPDLRPESRPQHERAVERVAGRLRAAGCDEVAWSGDELEASHGRRPSERGAEDIRDRWGVEVDVHPPGYERRPPAV
jgi:hypothetical protein